MRAWILTAILGVLLLPAAELQAAEKLSALIIDGQNNHNWKATTPLLKAILENSGRFTVDVATSPPKGEDLSGFKPEFSKYDVVVSNYNGQLWPKETQESFVNYVENGGGFVVVHAANNAFSKWEEYNRMIGLGGWGGRNEKDGPYLRYRDGKVVRDTSKGRGGSHGAKHEFVVDTREPNHPMMKGLPESWLHTRDELYDRLRGPAEEITVLATAYSDPKTRGTGEHEPILMTIDYGKGRVFHTVLGHDHTSMECVGFQFTLQRGAEWAATGKVTLNEVPDNFPTTEKTSSVNPLDQ